MPSQNAATFYHHAVDLFLVVWLVVAGGLFGAWLFAMLFSHTRPMLNCLIVAVALWVEGGCRQYLWTRRPARRLTIYGCRSDF